MTTEHPQPPESAPELVRRLRDLDQDRGHVFDHVPTQAYLDALAAFLGVEGLRKLRFRGEVSPSGKSDWRLDGHLGASVRQACVISGVPVTTRIEVDVTRLYVTQIKTDPDAEEVEFDGHDEVEPLGPVIDLAALLIEALALEIPDYPRAKEAELTQSRAAPPGITPMTDAETKPFAALQALKDKLENKD